MCIQHIQKIGLAKRIKVRAAKDSSGQIAARIMCITVTIGVIILCRYLYPEALQASLMDLFGRTLRIELKVTDSIFSEIFL